MTFLISIITGLSMGASALIFIYFGQKDIQTLQKRMASSFLLIGILSILLQIVCDVSIDSILHFMNIPTVLISPYFVEEGDCAPLFVQVIIKSYKWVVNI